MHISASQYIRLNLKKPTYKQLEQKISALEAALAKAAQTQTVAPELDEHSEDYQLLKLVQITNYIYKFRENRFAY